MGSVYRKTVTRRMPADAEIIVRKGQRYARYKDGKGRSKTVPVTTGKDGSDRIATPSGTFIAKYRDGSGVVQEVSTGCRDEQAARAVLADLERRAELVKAGVMTSAEDAIANFQATPLSDHFDAYRDYLRARQTSKMRLANMSRQFSRVCSDCGFKRLSDLDGAELTAWLLDREKQGMSAATRNGYRETFVMFANWCCSGTKPRMIGNPFTSVPKANVKTDRRRQRRALTEDELQRLIAVAAARPLAEYGRETVGRDAEAAGGRKKRSNWTYAELTLEGLPSALERARQRLQDNPNLVEKLERLGQERALVLKTLVLTGLRKGELASLTVGQLELDGAMPFAVLDAADEKNGEGNSIPLRADLAGELMVWLAEKLSWTRTESLRTGKPVPTALPAATPLFDVPAGLVRILDRDLKAAGIPKRDERGRTVDVHALRHSFGTLLSKGGVAPRTAQAAMRHSAIDLTMSVYTDPKLLDVHGALNALPALPLNQPLQTEPVAVSATGTDGNRQNLVAPAVAPTPYNPSHLESFPVTLACFDAVTEQRTGNAENPKNLSEKASLAVFASEALEVGMTGFEPATSTSRSNLKNRQNRVKNSVFVDFTSQRLDCKSLHRFSRVSVCFGCQRVEVW
ncbi:tyrosine-type recombinase/integrase [Planctellipticum variicoloris]|uniref:tyrosine-type recombinase/integrase n=1 Tax=Planctellipticum variicoloris TaxID=3064265 RepID=UPI003013408F|nr:site-specific integrase [Planctomycetaceae bacterium SH412]